MYNQYFTCKKCIPFLSNTESRSPEIIKAIQLLGYRVFHCENIMPSKAPYWLLDEYAKSEIRVIDRNGFEYEWPKCLFVPRCSLFEHDSKAYEIRCRDWIRKNFFSPPDNNVVPRISSKYRYIFRCFATLLLCARPKLAVNVPRLYKVKCLDCLHTNTNE